MLTNWSYNKSESQTLKSTPGFWSDIDYALVEDHEFEEYDVRKVTALFHVLKDKFDHFL